MCSGNSTEEGGENPRETGERWKGTGSKCILHTWKYFPQLQVFTKQSEQQICKGGGSLGYGDCRMTGFGHISEAKKKRGLHAQPMSQRHIIFL